MTIKIPAEAKYIVDMLEKNGFEAYVVGGCVRDSLLGVEPKDWDICTPALPEESIRIFSGHNIIKTGLRHGTITLVIDNKHYEVTTYRVDGVYSDNRRPDKVEFVGNLRDDLSRRDFTINAMAFNPRKGVVDYFGGLNDLNGIIKCVGKAGDRFREDALRIMRALRFASELRFSIEKHTATAMYEKRGLLKNIAVERIADEFNKLITGNGTATVLSAYAPIIAEFIPEIGPMIGFEQNNPHHCFDIWQHTLRSVESAQKEIVSRLTMMFHDIGKPLCYTETDGIGHFYGHPKISSDIAREILLRLKYDNATLEAVTQLILYHDADIKPASKHIKRWLNRIGEKRLRQLAEIKKADAMAQSERFRQEKLNKCDAIVSLMEEIIKQRQCFSLRDLAVNGGDLIAAGVPQGAAVGRILNKLLEVVIDELAENDKEELLRVARELIGGQ